MATKAQIKKEFQAQIDGLTSADSAEELFQNISQTSELTEKDKQDLQIKIQTKINELQQAEHDAAAKAGDKDKASKAIQTGDPDQIVNGKKLDSKRQLLSEAERGGGRPEKPMHCPEDCKIKEMTAEEFQAFQNAELEKPSKERKLVGVRPVRPESKELPVSKYLAIIRAAFVLFAILLGSLAPSVMAAPASDDIANLADFAQTSGWTVDASGDLVPAADSSMDIGASGNEVDNIYVDDVTATADITFRSTLLANGRAGGASSMSSSSTYLSAAGIAYSIIFKRVGGGGGLDSDGKGSILPNGTPGQVLSLYITALQSGGSWVITPNTSRNFNKLTLDTVGDNVTLQYLDDTIGWVVLANNGATLTMNQIN